MQSVKVDTKQHYAVYFPEEGRYSRPMTLKEAKNLVHMFSYAWLVNLDTAEVLN